MRPLLTNRQYKEYSRISRYSSFPIYYNKNDDKYVQGTTSQLSTETSFQSYTVQRNDTYDSIALYFYNNPTYYWIICDFNRVQDPFEKPVEGTLLKIPNFSTIYFIEN